MLMVMSMLMVAALQKSQIVDQVLRMSQRFVGRLTSAETLQFE
jgi:hypothetical protein